MPFHLYLLIALTVACAAAAVWATITSSRDTVRKRLQALTPGAATSDEAVSVIADDAPKNVGERVLMSLGRSQATGQSDQRKESLRSALRHAGFRRPSASYVALGVRVALMIGLPLLALPVAVKVVGNDLLYLLCFAGAIPAALGYVIPSFVIGKMVASRQVKVTAALPDVLDLLVLCMEAGLGLNAAIARVAEERAGRSDPLALEFSQLASELRVGVPRKDALANMADRVGSRELRTVVAQLIHTERLGGNVGPALRAHSDSVRAARRLQAEEIANKMPVKMLIPTMVFVLPLFVIVFTPVFIRVTEILSGG